MPPLIIYNKASITKYGEIDIIMYEIAARADGRPYMISPEVGTTIFCPILAGTCIQQKIVPLDAFSAVSTRSCFS